jgi:hypothetical protein
MRRPPRPSHGVALTNPHAAAQAARAAVSACGRLRGAQPEREAALGGEARRRRVAARGGLVGAAQVRL